MRPKMGLAILLLFAAFAGMTVLTPEAKKKDDEEESEYRPNQSISLWPEEDVGFKEAEIPGLVMEVMKRSKIDRLEFDDRKHWEAVDVGSMVPDKSTDAVSWIARQRAIQAAEKEIPENYAMVTDLPRVLERPVPQEELDKFRKPAGSEDEKDLEVDKTEEYFPAIIKKIVFGRLSTGDGLSYRFHKKGKKSARALWFEYSTMGDKGKPVTKELPLMLSGRVFRKDRQGDLQVSIRSMKKAMEFEFLGAKGVWKLFKDLKPKTQEERLALATMAHLVFSDVPVRWWEYQACFFGWNEALGQKHLNPWAFSYFLTEEDCEKATYIASLLTKKATPAKIMTIKNQLLLSEEDHAERAGFSEREDYQGILRKESYHAFYGERIVEIFNKYYERELENVDESGFLGAGLRLSEFPSLLIGHSEHEIGEAIFNLVRNADFSDIKGPSRKVFHKLDRKDFMDKKTKNRFFISSGYAGVEKCRELAVGHIHTVSTWHDDYFINRLPRHFEDIHYGIWNKYEGKLSKSSVTKATTIWVLERDHFAKGKKRVKYLVKTPLLQKKEQAGEDELQWRFQTKYMRELGWERYLGNHNAWKMLKGLKPKTEVERLGVAFMASMLMKDTAYPWWEDEFYISDRALIDSNYHRFLRQHSGVTALWGAAYFLDDPDEELLKKMTYLICYGGQTFIPDSPMVIHNDALMFENWKTQWENAYEENPEKPHWANRASAKKLSREKMEEAFKEGYDEKLKTYTDQIGGK